MNVVSCELTYDKYFMEMWIRFKVIKGGGGCMLCFNLYELAWTIFIFGTKY